MNTSPAHSVHTEIIEYGDSALMVVAHGATDEKRWHTIQTLSDTVAGAALQGVEDMVATLDAVLIEFDPLTVSFDDLLALLRSPEQRPMPASSTPRRLFHIPTHYGGTHGPDLESVAAELDLTPNEVIDAHTSATWTIRCLAAPAGAPLHDGSPFSRAIPRCPTPRTRVPGGSVALAGHHGFIYPVDSPGGWRLIGWTPWRLADFTQDPFIVHRPGDLLRFVPVTDPDRAEQVPVWEHVDA